MPSSTEDPGRGENGAARGEERWRRIILHADMDAFFAAIEQLDNPKLRGLPVIVGGPSRRGVVSTASYEARPFGVGSAMPTARALQLCPEAIVIPPRFDRYTAASKQIMECFRTFTPKVEPLSLDEAFLDMTGAEGLFGGPHEMGRQIKEAVVEATGGLTVSVGAANTKFLAKVASDCDKPDGLTVVPPSEVSAFLPPLPVSRLWGVGPKNRERLERIGLKTIGDVARSDPLWLSRELGALGRHIYMLANNDDRRDVISHGRAKSVGSERTLSEDVRGESEIRPHLVDAADRIARRLRRKQLLARGVRVKLKTTSFQLHSRQTTLSEPTDHAETLLNAALELLPRFDLRYPMRLVGLAAFDLVAPGTPVQGDLFAQPQRETEKRLDRTLDGLRDRFGESAVERGSRQGRSFDGVMPPTGGMMDE